MIDTMCFCPFGKLRSFKTSARPSVLRVHGLPTNSKWPPNIRSFVSSCVFGSGLYSLDHDDRQKENTVALMNEPLPTQLAPMQVRSSCFAWTEYEYAALRSLGTMQRKQRPLVNLTALSKNRDGSRFTIPAPSRGTSSQL